MSTTPAGDKTIRLYSNHTGTVTIRLRRWHQRDARIALTDMEVRMGLVASGWRVVRTGLFSAQAVFESLDWRPESVARVFHRHMADARRGVGLYA